MLLYKNPSNVPKAQQGIKVLPSIRDLINDSMNRKLLTAQATVKPVHTMQRDNTRTPSVKINPQLAMSGAKKHMNAVSQNKAEYEASQLESRKQYVTENMKEVYKHPLMSPGYFTPEGVLIGAMQGAVKAGPDLYNKNYAAAAGDALMMLPLAPAVGKAMQRVAKAVGTESGILSKAYKLNPNAVKANPEEFLYRARPVGQDPAMNQTARTLKKIAAGENVKFFERNVLTTTDPNVIAREKYFGRWFENDPKRLEHYIDMKTSNFWDNDVLEIIRTKLPKKTTSEFNVGNFKDADLLSLSPKTEFVLPQELMNTAKSFPASELPFLIKEHNAFNKPHWLKGFKTSAVDPGIQQKAAPHDLFDLNIVRKPSGSIGNQGATQEGAMSILKSIGVDVKATGTDGVSMRDMVEHLKSNPKDASKFKAFLQKEPINVNELPGGEYQINDGHHRATLSYYSGEEKIPAVIKNKGEYTTTMPTTMPTASKSLGGIIYKIK